MLTIRRCLYGIFYSPSMHLFRMLQRCLYGIFYSPSMYSPAYDQKIFPLLQSDFKQYFEDLPTIQVFLVCEITLCKLPSLYWTFIYKITNKFVRCLLVATRIKNLKKNNILTQIPLVLLRACTLTQYMGRRFIVSSPSHFMTTTCSHQLSPGPISPLKDHHTFSPHHHLFYSVNDQILFSDLCLFLICSK